jgi:hypothetical protein
MRKFLLLLLLALPAQAETFTQWKWVANQNETFTLQVPARVRYTLDYPHDFNEEGLFREVTLQPGTYTCNNATMGGQLSWFQKHICRRLVQELTIAPLAPQTTGHPFVDSRLEFLPRKAQTVQLIGPKGGDSAPNSQAKFRIGCTTSRMGKDDPIVYPGQPGAAHHHTFFGAEDVTASSIISETGGSTCAGGTMNRSGYWIPSIIDTRFGKPIVPFANFIYYQQGYDLANPAVIVAPPPGFRMIAGPERAGFNCPGGAGNGTMIPSACPVGSEVLFSIEFPRCWDGVNLDSANHKSHVAHATGSGCPATHPVRIPQIRYNIHYRIRAGDDVSKWRLSSDDYDWTTRGGLSAHADWMNGWDQTKLQLMITECLHAGRDCGTDGLNGRPLNHY